MATKLRAQDARDILAAAHGGNPQGKAAEIATQNDKLPLDEVALIGVFGPADALEALIREPSGDILKVRRGERAPSGTVVAIAADRVVLKAGARTRVLRLPRT